MHDHFSITLASSGGDIPANVPAWFDGATRSSDGDRLAFVGAIRSRHPRAKTDGGAG